MTFVDWLIQTQPNRRNLGRVFVIVGSAFVLLGGYSALITVGIGLYFANTEPVR